MVIKRYRLMAAVTAFLVVLAIDHARADGRPTMPSINAGAGLSEELRVIPNARGTGEQMGDLNAFQATNLDSRDTESALSLQPANPNPFNEDIGGSSSVDASVNGLGSVTGAQPSNQLPQSPSPVATPQTGDRSGIPQINQYVPPQGIPIACMLDTNIRLAQTAYWNRVSVAGSGGEAHANPGEALPDAGPDQSQYPESAGGWCAPEPTPDYPLEPFTLWTWGPLLVLTLGFSVFWAVRGFRHPE